MSRFSFPFFPPKDSYLGELRLFLQVRAAFMFERGDFFAGWVGLAECWPGGRGYVPGTDVEVFEKVARARARARARLKPPLPPDSILSTQRMFARPRIDFIYTENSNHCVHQESKLRPRRYMPAFITTAPLSP